MYQINSLYTLNLHSVVTYQSYLNKAVKNKQTNNPSHPNKRTKAQTACTTSPHGEGQIQSRLTPPVWRQKVSALPPAETLTRPGAQDSVPGPAVRLEVGSGSAGQPRTRGDLAEPQL